MCESKRDVKAGKELRDALPLNEFGVNGLPSGNWNLFCAYSAKKAARRAALNFKCEFLLG